MSKAFDLVKFRDFCAGKPAGERYFYVDIHDCPIAQFLRSRGFRGLIVGPEKFFGFRWLVVPWFGTVPEDWDRASALSLTFGQLASRLSTLIREGGNV